MNSNQLIKTLRRRLLADGSDPKHLVKSASEKQILDCFIRCYVCREQLIDWPQQFGSPDAFFATINAALTTHPCTAPPAIAGIQSETVQGVLDLQKFPEDACFSFRIGREEIEHQHFGRIQSQFALNRLPVGAALLRLRGRGLILVDGYNHDPRELHEIPEVRQFYAETVKRLPWLAFFLAPVCCAPILLSLVPHVSTVRRDGAPMAGVFFDYREMGLAVDAFVSGVAPVLARAGLGNDEAMRLMEQMLDEIGSELEGMRRAA